MKIESLGFVEVRGAANAIAVADAMVKASNVRILSESRLDPGQVTVVVEGDLGACHAAVEVGAEVARRHNCLIGVLLKGKPDPAVEALFHKAAVPPAPPDPEGSGGSAVPPAPPDPERSGGSAVPARPRRAAPGPDGQTVAPLASSGSSLRVDPPGLSSIQGIQTPSPPLSDGVTPAAKGASFPAQKVIDFIASGESGRTVAQLAVTFNVSSRTARTWVRELADQKLVERFNRGIRLARGKQQRM